MSRDFPEFDLGAVPPLGSLLGIPTFVDPDVMAHEAVVFAGSQRESVKIRTAALFDDESDHGRAAQHGIPTTTTSERHASQTDADGPATQTKTTLSKAAFDGAAPVVRGFHN